MRTLAKILQPDVSKPLGSLSPAFDPIQSRTPVLHTHAQSPHPSPLSLICSPLSRRLQLNSPASSITPSPTGPTRHPSGPTPRPRSFSDHQPHSFQESLLNLFSIVAHIWRSQGEVICFTANREDPKAGSPPPPTPEEPSFFPGWLIGNPSRTHCTSWRCRTGRRSTPGSPPRPAVQVAHQFLERSFIRPFLQEEEATGGNRKRGRGREVEQS